MYRTIEVNREKLTLMGVQFPNIESLESTANALGNNMFEGLEPTKELIQVYLDWKNGDLNESDFVTRLYSLYGE
jgi:putative transcriptional regulator